MVAPDSALHGPRWFTAQDRSRPLESGAHWRATGARHCALGILGSYPRLVPFPTAVREEALFRSRRSCSLCNEFAGLYTDVHHIVQEADGGPNTLENALPLCDRCHGEVGHYNARHPKGTK
jgi:hypothetical protein